MQTPTNKRVLQFGLIALFASCFWKFGFGEVSGLVTATGLLIGALNLLAGSQRPNAKNPVRSTVRKAVQKPIVTTAAACFMWLGAVILAESAYIEKGFTLRSRTLKGLVRTATGLPADKALVLLGVGNEHFSAETSAGIFSFPAIPLRTPSTTASLHVEWTEPSSGVRLLTDVNVPITVTDNEELRITLPDSPGTVQARYYVLKGLASDFLLHYHRLDPSFAELFGGQPIIIRNAVYDSVDGLVKDFSYPFEQQFVSGLADGRDVMLQDSGKLALSLRGKPIFCANGSMDLAGCSTFFENWLLTNMQSSPWRLLAKPMGATAFPFELSWSKFLTRNDLRVLAADVTSHPRLRQYARMCLHLSPNADLPLFEARCTYTPEGCGDFRVQLILRSAWMNVALLENVSDHAVSIGDFECRQVSGATLRSISTDDALLTDVEPKNIRLFDLGLLRQHETLLVPLRFVFTYANLLGDGFGADRADASIIDQLAGPDLGRNREFLNFLTSHRSGLTISIDQNKSRHLLTSDRLRTLALQAVSPNLMIKEDYVYGVSQSIEHVTVNGDLQSLRSRSKGTITYQDGSDVGSCPTVYTRSLQAKEWIRVGHVLTKRHSPLMSGTDSIVIPKDDCIVEIREEEPETSHISEVKLLVRTPSRSFILRPEGLKKSSGVLKMGQKLVLLFPRQPQAVSVHLLVTGYYERPRMVTPMENNAH